MFSRRHLLKGALVLAASLDTPASAQADPPIIFLHGNGDHAALWITTLWRFESNGYPSELLQAFRLAVAGGNYLHPRLGALMATGEEGGTDSVELSDRERDVVRLIANGYTNPEIAEKLNVAERTVKTYRARAIEKLGFSSRAEITAYVRRVGLEE